MSEIHLGCWGAPELSPPPVICKPSFFCAAPLESCHDQGHFLGLEEDAAGFIVSEAL